MRNASRLQRSVEQSAHEAVREFWRERIARNGSVKIGESRGAREIFSEIALRIEATNADEDMDVRGRSPIPECLSDSPICETSSGWSWDGGARWKIFEKEVSILVSNVQENEGMGG